MKPLPRFRPLLFRFRLLLFLLLLPGWLAAAPFYSRTGGGQVSGTCVACGNGGVFNFGNATDADLTNYATLYTSPLSAVPSVWLRLPLDGTGLANHRAGLLVASSGNVLNLSALGAVRIRTYLGAQLRDDQLVDAALARSILLNTSTRPSQLEFLATQSFDQVELVVETLVGVNYAVRVYYAYAVPALVKPTVEGVLSQFPSAAGNFSTAGATTGSPVTVCANTDVDDAANAANNSLTDYAQFSSLLTVACPQSLRVKLNGDARAGYYAGFVVGSAGLLDVAVLPGLRLRTYKAGVEQESATGVGLIQLQALPGGQAQVSFLSTLAFDEVRIERVGAVTALDNLRIYYGFGVEAKAFDPTTLVQSSFANPMDNSEYSTSDNGALCAGLAVFRNGEIIQPANAADNDPATAATFSLPLCVGRELRLRLKLNGPGQAGNRAGVVVGGSGLLDATVLEQLTVATFDATGTLLESASGRALLALNVLPNGRRELTFATTQDFWAVQLAVRGDAAVLNNLSVFNAFADDRPSLFPLVIASPGSLPVELTSFAAKWSGTGAQLDWATASEHASSYFVLERAPAGSTAFQPVGQVAAAGSSTQLQRYQWRDAEAATLETPQLYYRLRQVDADGRVAYSPVVTLKTKARAATALQCYPNPATGARITLAGPPLPVGITARLYTAAGQLALQTPLLATQELELKNLSNGLYQLVVIDSAGQQLGTQRLLIAR